MENYLFGLLGMLLLVFVMTKYTNFNDQKNLSIEKICLMFVVLLSIYFIMISTKKILYEKFSQLKCRKRDENGAEIMGCYYDNVIQDAGVSSGSCFYSLPKNKECPSTYEEYKKLVSQVKSVSEEGEEGGEEGEENDIVELPSQPEKPECDLEEILYIMPQLTDEQIKQLEKDEINTLSLNGKDINVADIKKCLKNKESLKSKLLAELRTENFEDVEENNMDATLAFKQKCALLRGAGENSNNQFIRDLLSEMVKDIKCELDCKMKDTILNNLESKLTSGAGDYSEEKKSYFKAYQNLYNAKCEAEDAKKSSENADKLRKNTPKDGYVIIPGKGKPPIYNFYDSNVSNVDGLSFNNRDEFIEYSKKYVCNRSPHELQAYKTLGEKVNGLDWWNDASKSHMGTPDNKLNLHRVSM